MFRHVVCRSTRGSPFSMFRAVIGITEFMGPCRAKGGGWNSTRFLGTRKVRVTLFDPTMVRI